MTKAQARKLAAQIHSRFGARIAEAVAGTPIPQEFMAGLIANEAGKDRAGNIREDATRFEPGVFRKLVQVRDGARKSWSGIRQPDLKGADDSALRALATSYSLTQVMGWHVIHNLDCTVAQLRDPKLHLRYAARLLQMNAADGDFERGAYMGEFREWNTGSESGRTYDPKYVENGMAVMEAYRELGPYVPEPPAPKAPIAEIPVKVEPTGEVHPQETIVVPPATPADNSSKKSLWATIAAALTSAGVWLIANIKDIFGTAKDSGITGKDAVRWTLVVIGIVFSLYMLRQLAMGMTRLIGSIMFTLRSMQYHADPTKNNVVVGQPAPPKEDTK